MTTEDVLAIGVALVVLAIICGAVAGWCKGRHDKGGIGTSHSAGSGSDKEKLIKEGK